MPGRNQPSGARCMTRCMLCKNAVNTQITRFMITGSRRDAGVRGDGIRRPVGTEGGDVILIPLCLTNQERGNVILGFRF